MAAYISIPRDLTRVKFKVFFGLTKRQVSSQVFREIERAIRTYERASIDLIMRERRT